MAKNANFAILTSKNIAIYDKFLLSNPIYLIQWSNLRSNLSINLRGVTFWNLNKIFGVSLFSFILIWGLIIIIIILCSFGVHFFKTRRLFGFFKFVKTISNDPQFNSKLLLFFTRGQNSQWFRRYLLCTPKNGMRVYRLWFFLKLVCAYRNHSKNFFISPCWLAVPHM